MKPDAAFQAKMKSWSRFVESFRELRQDELKPGTTWGVTYQSFLIDTPHYLKWLVRQLKDRSGVPVERVPTLRHFHDVFREPYNASLAFNCTGLASGSIPGIADSAMYPIRGQVVVVKDVSDVGATIMRHSPSSITYIIPRPYTNSVVLGGCYQERNGSGDSLGEESASILERTNALHPNLTLGRGVEHFDVMREAVGLRPGRDGGARIEREIVHVGGKKKTIVHNYGAAGVGYQSSYGMAKAAVQAAMPTSKL